MRLSVHTVKLSFTTLAGTCAFWAFPDSGLNYIHFQNYKNGGKICTSIMLSTIVQKRRARRAAKRRAIWVRWQIKNRNKLDAFHALQKELEDQDSESFRISLRMDKARKHVDKSSTHSGKHDASRKTLF